MTTSTPSASTPPPVSSLSQDPPPEIANTVKPAPEGSLSVPAPVVPVNALTPSGPPGKFSVPGGLRKPHADIGRSMIWIYGEPKIGKTTFASRFPGVWFIATEKGQDWVEVREPTLVRTWDEFLELCAYIQTNKPMFFGDGAPIKTLCIDTIDGLFRMCFESVCGGLGVDDPGELPHGKGWTRLNAEFDRVMNKIRQWPYGLICISHVRSKEVKLRGVKRDRFEPNIGAAGSRWALGATDLIMYAHAIDVAEVDPTTGAVTGKIITQRVLLCQPQQHAVAGGRMTDLFKIPALIPLDYDVLRAYFTGTAPSEKLITEAQ